MTTYGVWCEVWGGVTGTRSSWLQSNGEVWVFTNRREAEQQAMLYTRTIANNPHRKAEFRYTVQVMQK